MLKDWEAKYTVYSGREASATLPTFLFPLFSLPLILSPSLLFLIPHSTHNSWLGASIVPAWIPSPLLLPSLPSSPALRALACPVPGSGRPQLEEGQVRGLLLPYPLPFWSQLMASVPAIKAGSLDYSGPQLFLMPSALEINRAPLPQQPGAQQRSFPVPSSYLWLSNAFPSRSLLVNLPDLRL